MDIISIKPFEKPFSKIGLGCVTFGREIGREASFAMMDHARDRGVTFFDTAAAYGAGASETIVGSWLRARKNAADQVMIATKMLPPYTKQAITESVHASLERLGVESIDLCYLHRWDPSLLVQDTAEHLQHLILSGKVKRLGVSNFSAAQLSQLITLQLEAGFEPVRSVQNNKNLAVDDTGDGLTELVGARKMALVTYSPLGAGFLTGKYENDMPAKTRFSLIPGHQDIYFKKTARQRLHQLQALASTSGYTTVQLALAWVLHHRGVASVLVGGRTPRHLDQAFEALNFQDIGVLAALNDIGNG